MAGTVDTAVVHLVRAGNDPAALERFLCSYARHPAGAPHRLVLLLKGFATRLPAELHGLLARVAHQRIDCPDRGYDVGSYCFAAQRISQRIVLFLNSYSVLQGDRWLAKLLDAYHRTGVGLVGATGSNDSMSASLLRGFVDDHGLIRSDVIHRAMAIGLGIALRPAFPDFPNPHIRSNAFLLARTDFLALRPWLLRTKLDAWLFESGRASMTRRMQKRGLQVLVVGADGLGYPPEDWPRSMTFWQSHQQNLLIADNRTAAYQCAPEALRRVLQRRAWGTPMA